MNIPVQNCRLATVFLPLFGGLVHAGFPSPAEDFIERRIDLNAELIPHPSATFLIRANGESMEGAGIFSGDLLVVDRALTARDGSIVVAVVDGGFTVKRFRQKNGRVFLCPENDSFHPIEVVDEDAQVWGVVAYSIHKTS